VRKTLLSILAVAILLGVANIGFAQGEMKPVAIVSVAGYDRLKADIGVIGRLCGKPDMAQGLEMMLQMMTQGKGLAVLDAKRPWGVAVFARPGNNANLPKTIVYGFVPVTDLKQLMEVAKTNPKLAAAIKLNGGRYEIQAGGPPLWVQQKGDWAVITIMNPLSDDLANAPADPLKLLGDLPKNYDLAVRVCVKNIPETLRQAGLAQLQARAALTPGAGDRINEATPLITEMIDQLDDVTLGLKIDPGTSKTCLDLEMTAKTGTKLADRLAAMKPGKTAFAGVRIPEAAIVVSKTGTLTADDVAAMQAKFAAFHQSFLDAMGQQGLSDEQVNLMTRFSSDVLDVAKKTLGTKKIDGGFAMLLDPAAVTIVGGAAVVDGDKLEKALKQLADGMKNTDPDTAKLIKLNAETHEGVHLHHFSAPTSDPRLVPMVGDVLDVVFGTAADKAMMAAGRDAAKTLKKVLDQSKAATEESPAFEIKLALGKIAKFAAASAEDEQTKLMAAMLAAALEKAGDKDHATITASPVSQGVRVRVEIEEGLFKAMAAMGQQAMGKFMGAVPPGGPPVPPPPPSK
jgi:hypothetical protein